MYFVPVIKDRSMGLDQALEARVLWQTWRQPSKVCGHLWPSCLSIEMGWGRTCAPEEKNLFNKTIPHVFHLSMMMFKEQKSHSFSGLLFLVSNSSSFPITQFFSICKMGLITASRRLEVGFWLWYIKNYHDSWYIIRVNKVDIINVSQVLVFCISYRWCLSLKRPHVGSICLGTSPGKVWQSLQPLA